MGHGSQSQRFYRATQLWRKKKKESVVKYKSTDMYVGWPNWIAEDNEYK